MSGQGQGTEKIHWEWGFWGRAPVSLAVTLADRHWVNLLLGAEGGRGAVQSSSDHQSVEEVRDGH